MWARCSKMLAPLTDLVGEWGETKTTKKNKTKKQPWKWDPIHQQAFNNPKAAIAKETVLAYPDFSKPFEIFAGASSIQLGAVITQDNRPIAFFSRKLSEAKLSEAQQKYSITEIELLAIVETLKEFKGMLWGQIYNGLHRSQKSHKRCPRTNLWQSIPVAVTIGIVCPPNNIYNRNS